MTPSTDQAPGEVPRTGARRAMLALAVFLSLAWLYYLFVANAQWQLRLDAAHRQAAVRARELFEEQLATLTEAEAAELRPLLEEGLRRASEDAALKEQHWQSIRR